MKSIAVIFALFICSMSVLQAQVNISTTSSVSGDQSGPALKIKWEATIIDLGEVPYNIPAKAIYQFTNVSTEPIIILNVRSSCGCTVPDYSKEPILPEGTSSVTAIYNARALGSFQKTITVVTNDNMEHRLTIKGTVVNKQ